MQRTALEISQQSLPDRYQATKQELADDLHACETELEAVRNDKRVIQGKFTQASTLYKAKTDRLKGKLAKVHTELESLELQASELEMLMRSKRTEKQSHFEQSIQVLKQSTEAVSSQKQAVEAQIQALTDELTGLKQKKTGLASQYAHNSKEVERLEQKKAVLREEFEELELKYPRAFAEVTREFETQAKLGELSTQKQTQESELNSLTAKITELEANIEKAVNELERWTSHTVKSGVSTVDEAEIEELEEFLKRKCSEMKVSWLDQAVEEVAARNDISIHNCILKEQFARMEDKELLVIQQTKLQQEQLEAELKQKQRALNQSMVQCLPTQSFPNSGRDQSIQTLNREVKHLRQQMERLERQQSVQLRLIQQWKDSNRKCLLSADISVWPSDTALFNMIKHTFAKAETSSHQRGALESILTRYVKFLTDREGLANTTSEAALQLKDTVKEQESQINELHSELSSLKFERDVAHRELVRILTTEKQTLKQFNQAKYIAQVKRIRSAKAGDNTHSNHEQIQRRVRNHLDEYYANVSYWDKKIQYFRTTSPAQDLLEVEDIINTIKGKLKTLHTQLHIISCAEAELGLKIESMVENHKNTQSQLSSYLLQKHGGSVDFQKIRDLKLQRTKAQDRIRVLDQELMSQREEYGKAMETVEVAETKFKHQIKVLRADIQALLANKPKTKQTLRHTMKQTLRHTVKQTPKKQSNEPQKIELDKTFNHSLTHDCAQTTILLTPKSMKKQSNRKPTRSFASTVFTTCSKSELITELAEPYQTFIQELQPLLEGVTIYCRKGGKFPAYDPLVDDSIEKYGFERKTLLISKQLTKLSIKNHSRTESNVLVSQISSSMVPKLTNEIVKAQNKSKVEELDTYKEQYLQMKKDVKLQFDSPVFIALSQNCAIYPFALRLTNGLILEFIAPECSVFKTCTKSFSAIVKHSTELPYLKYYIH